MIRRFVKRAVSLAVLSALAVVFSAAPANAQSATYTEDFEALQGKFNSLANAMGADTYDWRPMEGVRSVSEVYMLIAAEAYFMPSFWGAAAPDGIEISNAVFAELAKVTAKADVLEHLATALAYCQKELAELADDQLSVEIAFFGQQRTVSEAIFLLLVDMHEHLGQAIAYARTNEVVPPWSAGG